MWADGTQIFRLSKSKSNGKFFVLCQKRNVPKTCEECDIQNLLRPFAMPLHNRHHHRLHTLSNINRRQLGQVRPKSLLGYRN